MAMAIDTLSRTILVVSVGPMELLQAPGRVDVAITLATDNVRKTT